MQDRQRDKLNSFVLLKEFLLASILITNKVVIIETMFALFQDHITEIFAVSELQERDNTGVTKTKTQIKKSLITLMMFISKKCIGYASGVDDLIFLHMIKFTPTQLNTMADADLVKKAEDMIINVTPKLTVLIGYHITLVELDALDALTASFKEIYTTPTGIKKTKSVLTDKLDRLFKAADAQLLKIDDQVNTLFDTDPDFCAEFKRKRMVLNLAGRLRAFQMWIMDDETQQPFAKAAVMIFKKESGELINGLQSTGVSKKIISRKAGIKGGVANNNMPAGEYSYEVSYGGCITETGSFFINDGVMTEIIVRMKRNSEV